MSELGQNLANVSQLFEDGHFEKLCEIFETPKPLPVAHAEQTTLFSVVLATAALGYFSSTTLKRWLKVIPLTIRPDLRYRAMINCRLWKEAAVFRRAPERRADMEFQSRCRFAASVLLLSRQKRHAGFGLYHHRMSGDGKYNQHIRHIFDYRPAHETPAELVFLEQGVGDRFLHLAHLKAHHPDVKQRFAVVDRWKPVLKWLFPLDEVVPLETFANGSRLTANASGDYLAKAFFETGSIAPKIPLGTPVRQGPPRFGVVWRGGGTQNRRQERSVDLRQMLSLLPEDAQLAVLQPKLTVHERAHVLANPNMFLPAFDVSDDIATYARTIAGLAGVIGIDNSGVHVAGVFDVPSYTFMNASAHWYWGREKKTSSIYPKGRTALLNALDKEDIAHWMQDCRKSYQKRAPALIRSKSGYPEHPVLVTGVPRSGTSLTMGLLHRCGLWTGKTVPGGPPNPDGFFESIAIREKIVKSILKDSLGCDPLGVSTLPTPAPKYVLPDLRERVIESIEAEGYSGEGPWGYKDAKMALMWNLWTEAFPDATWVIVSRTPEDVVRSCINTRFMAQHSRDPMFWRYFHEAYTQRLAQLRSHVNGQITEVRYEKLVSGDFSAIEAACERAGLIFDSAKAQSFARTS